MSLRHMIETIRYSQSGNVFFALFGAVALVGVVGAASMQVLKGPVRSMSEVTKRTVAENNMIASAKLALIAATSQSDSGDCDADGYVEPVPFETAATGAPTGGGFLPAAIGAALNDPWDTRYGYCSWDHGAVTTACGGSNYLAGENAATGYAIAIISAGPDRQFQTSCNAYPSAAAVDKVSGSDDIVLGYTYGEASALAGGLWNLKSGDAETAEIDRNLEVKDSGGNVTFALDAQSGLGDFIGLTTGSIAGKSGPLDVTGGLKFESDSIALNAACTEEDSFAFDTDTDMLVRCDGSIWVPSGGSDNLGNHEATENIQLKGFWLSNDGGDEGLQVADDGVVSASGSLNVGGDLAMTGSATVGTTLDVAGASTLSTLSTSGLATLNSASVTQNAGIGGALDVTGGTTLTSLTTSGAADLVSASIMDTLDVIGATSLSTLSTSGLSTLNALAVTNNAAVGGTLDMTSGKITNLLDPTLAQDAASKAYVDARVASGTGFTEADPQVGTIQSSKWCVGNNDGSAIVCDQNMPVPADTLSGLSCSSGQVPKWNGTAWACAADNASGGVGGATSYLLATNSVALVNVGAADTKVTLGNASASAGSDIALSSGNITLKAGQSYMLSGVVRIDNTSPSASWVTTTFYNVTSGAYFGAAGVVASANYNQTWSDYGDAKAFITPSVDTTVQFRVSGASDPAVDISNVAVSVVKLGGGSGGGSALNNVLTDYEQINKSCSGSGNCEADCPVGKKALGVGSSGTSNIVYNYIKADSTGFGVYNSGGGTYTLYGTCAKVDSEGGGGTGVADNLGDHVATQSVRLFKATGPAGNVVAGVGDNLGNHTATQALAMGGFNITNAGTITGANLATTGAVQVNKPTDYWSNADIYRVGQLGQLDSHGAYEVTLTSNGYRNASNQWTSLAANGSTGGSQIRLGPTGNIVFAADATKATGSAAALTPRMTITNAGAVSVPGTITAAAFVGDGSGLTGLPSGADNLGNHTATQTLALGTNWLNGDSGAEGISINTAGGVRMDYGNATYDVWIQGGAGTSGATRRLALLGTEAGMLHLNYASEYASGVTIGGPITITAGALTDNSILTADIAPNAVTTAEIAADTIAAADIAANAITSSELANDAVTIAKLAATGTPSATTFLRGDNTWATPAAGGGVTARTSVTCTDQATGIGAQSNCIATCTSGYFFSGCTAWVGTNWTIHDPVAVGTRPSGNGCECMAASNGRVNCTAMCVK